MFAVRVRRGEHVQWSEQGVTPVALTVAFRVRTFSWAWHVPIGLMVDASGARSAEFFRPILDINRLARLVLLGALLALSTIVGARSLGRRGQAQPRRKELTE